MLIHDCDTQVVKNNKEESIALAKHTREMTSKLVDALQAWSDLDSPKPSIEDFFE
jgi:hypothetical protein